MTDNAVKEPQVRKALHQAVERIVPLTASRIMISVLLALALGGLGQVDGDNLEQQVGGENLEQADGGSIDFFERKVRPLLVENCLTCHGPEAQKGSLRLDSRHSILAGGESGPAVVPGNPEKSLLISAVSHGESLRMPPKAKLTDDQIAVLSEWVKRGSPWPEVAAEVRSVATGSRYEITAADRRFWAFQPVAEPPVPAVSDAAWARTPIDRFILAKLDENGLRPSPPAHGRALLRRVSFDLTGLPPAPGEVAAFLADDSPGAYARAVDRLLASPRYGERWARHWLDVARYAEDQAHTFESRKYPDGFRYRDWVIRAFNADLPYDRFILHQIAGDLLDGPGRSERLAALGFFALGPVYYGKAAADELDDRVDALTRGFLALTVACARCHDHKYDPIPTRDYYSLAGVFASSEYKEYVLTPQGEIDEAAIQEPTDRVKDKEKKAERRPAIHGLRDKPNPSSLRVHIRGNPANLGEEAPRRFLAILAGDDPPPFAPGSGRLELARAIASPENPLVARVMANRIWMHLFGRGLVNTPSNFGALGERPTHPELLDYLASRFIAGGWSVKSLQREILLSATYRMGSLDDREAARVDPENRWLWRMNRRRLEVEPLRDAMLAVAGTLDAAIGGPSSDLSSPDNRRRTLYGSVSRHQLDPLLRLFDFPDPNLTSERRPISVVPLQQLFFLNSEFIVSQARALAARLGAGSEPDDAARIHSAFLLLYGRSPSEREERMGLEYLSLASGPDGAADEGRAGHSLSSWESYAQALLSANEFAFID